MLPSLRKILFCCQFGVSSFVGEISSGVITVVFNMIILGLAGNTGVAAYGVVANTSLVAVALFNGIAQGSQPLVSEAYGRDIHKDVISRGFVAIIFFAFILSAIFGLNGVWMAFPAAEFVTMLITLCGLRRIKFVDKNS